MANTALNTIEHRTDLCVVGGGMAGVCAAVAAAREGCRVVLMQERPMLGGNASSEIRMWVCGAQGDNVAETGIAEELFTENLRCNPYKTYPLFDAMLYDLVKKEPNIELLLNCSCLDAAVEGNKICSVTGWQSTTQRFHRVKATYFADCSGDSILAPCTGARYSVGREAAAEYGEELLCPPTADRKTMGNSCLLNAHKGTVPVTFTAPDFAKKLTDEEVQNRLPDIDCNAENFWFLELGGNRDTIGDAEEIRDELVALAFGMWDYVKNSGKYFRDASLWQLDFVGFLPGKRESRRMRGPKLLTATEILSGEPQPDVVAFGGWSLDDHDPDGFYHKGEPNTHFTTPAPYPIPYGSLYSENIENLFFAGRNISVTHAALSSTRVMGTCMLCGQAVGTAAAVALRHQATPDEVRRRHIDELQDTLLWNDCLLPGRPRTVNELTRNARLTVNGQICPAAERLRDGDDRNGVSVFEPGDSIAYTFEKPVTVRQVRLIFDSDLNRNTLPGDYHERHHMTRSNLLPDAPVMALPTTLCKSYTLTCTTADGQTHNLRGEQHNARRLVLTDVPPVPITAVTLTMTTANSGGKEMRLFSFDCR